MNLSIYKKTTTKSTKLILYCHTYSGNKTEGKFLFQYLPLDFDIALFDFAGCGNSPDAYITYGHKEKFDINNMLKHIDDNYEYSEYYIWGRSMGAVITSIFAQNFISKHAQKEKNKENLKSVNLDKNEIVENNHLSKIKGLVLDSPFTELFIMIQGIINFLDVLSNKVSVPYFASWIALSMIKGSLKEKTGFDVLSISPLEACKTITIPIVFILGDSDEMVGYQRFKEMFDLCPSDKKKFILEIDCEHPDPRSIECISQTFEFFGCSSKRVFEEESKIQGKVLYIFYKD